jgi:hypothetical protein
VTAPLADASAECPVRAACEPSRRLLADHDVEQPHGWDTLKTGEKIMLRHLTFIL